MGSFWKNKSVLVTGGGGFIGSHLVERLLQVGAKVAVVDDLKRGNGENLKGVKDDIEMIVADLLEPANCKIACRGREIVMHLAAKIRGVGYNVQHHAEMFYSNALMNLNMMEAARHECERFLCVSTVGIYAGDCCVPTPESDGFKAEPEMSGYGYGWAKRLAEIQARCYQLEYGMKVAITRPYNVYGPRDHFNPETAAVVPSKILQVMQAKDKVVIWGDGLQTRSFTYVDDEVTGMMLAVEKYFCTQPLNIASEEEITIKDLVQLIIQLMGKKLDLEFDLSKPTGAVRRCADISKAKALLGYSPRTSLREGIARTIAWYRETHPNTQSVNAYSGV